MKYTIHSLLVICSVFIAFVSCKNNTKTDTTNMPKEWNFVKNIPLDSFGIISIAQAKNAHFWLSDADNNQLVLIDKEGKVLETKIGDFDRPMHISKNGNALLIANYGSDNLLSFQNGKAEKINFSEKFDAPSGIDQNGDKIVVADFYNHRIVYKQGNKTTAFGKKGNATGELTYPTDVQFANEKIYVADAYNHRIQVFDLAGKHLQTIGEAEKMNATTGVFVNDKNVFATDFENSRILIYDLEGKLVQEIKENLDKPTDVLVADNQLFVTNYHGRFLSIFDYSIATAGYYVCPMNCFPPDKKDEKCPKCGMDKKAFKQ
jgi:DNA-binding beta-propeller fold protein YncE